MSTDYHLKRARLKKRRRIGCGSKNKRLCFVTSTHWTHPKRHVIAMRAQIAAEKMAAFNNAFCGSSGGHEASGGGEI
jgi:hypothetical protein